MGEEWWSPDASGATDASAPAEDGSWWDNDDASGVPTTVVAPVHPSEVASDDAPFARAPLVEDSPQPPVKRRDRRLRLPELDRGLVAAIALLVVASVGLLVAVRNGWSDHTVYDPTRLQMASGPSEVNLGNEALVGAVDLPDVRRLSRERAIAVLGEAGIPEQNVVVDPIDRAGPADVVIEQDPPHGTNDPEQVTLRVSRAVSMPDYLGRAEADVVKQLRTYGATVEVSYRFEARAVTGAVLEQSVAVGEPMPEAVQLVVAGEGERVGLDLVEQGETDCYSGGDMHVNGALLPSSISCSLSTSYVSDEPSRNTYVLSKQFNTFIATLGVSDDSAPNLPVQFRILVDQRVVLDTTLTLGQSQDVVIPTTDALQMHLEARYLGTEKSDYSTLEAVFGSPTFVTSPDVAAKFKGN